MLNKLLLTDIAQAPSLSMQRFSQGYCTWAITRKVLAPVSSLIPSFPRRGKVRTNRYANFTHQLSPAGVLRTALTASAKSPTS